MNAILFISLAQHDFT